MWTPAIHLQLAAIPCVVAGAFLASTVSAEAPAGVAWPGWRGDGSGATAADKLPTRWNAATNVAWCVELPGEGNSSPILWGKRVVVTSWSDAGRKRRVLCYEAETGRLVWRREFTVGEPARTYPKNGYASSTPVTDGERVYVFFDAPGLVAMSLDTGELLWTRAMGGYKTPWNFAASPALAEGIVIVTCDHLGESFVMGVNAADGSVAWKAPRETKMQFASPLVIEHAGKKQVVVNGGTVVSYDPKTGKEIWRCRGMRKMCVPTAVYADGLVWVVSGRNGPIMAIDPSGKGDITETHIRVHVNTGGPYVPSPVAWGSMLVVPGDNGKLTILNGRGELVSTERMPGHFSASPLLAGDRLYWSNEAGRTYVLRIEPSMRSGRDRIDLIPMGRNDLGDRTLASPVPWGNRLYVRTASKLYCIRGDEQVAVAETPGHKATLQDVMAEYDRHKAVKEGPEIAIRRRAVEQAGAIRTPEARAFLLTAARKDNHWDVCEAAAKSLAAQGAEAKAELVELLAKDKREFTKGIAARALGEMGAGEAVEPLIAAAAHKDPTVRIAALRAMAQIAQAGQGADAVHLALTGALGDGEGIVRAAAIRALATVHGKSMPAGVRKVIEPLTKDGNPLVVEAARDVLGGGAGEDTVPEVRVKAGGTNVAAAVQTKEVSVGPVSMRLVDGELRYVHVGAAEVIRRVYLGVRTKKYDTIMPKFTSAQTKYAIGSFFNAELAGVCQGGGVDYGYTARISGIRELVTDGDCIITYAITGKTNADSETPRIGLCVLLGTEALAGRPFTAEMKEGEPVRMEFPELPLPKHGVLKQWKSLRYTCPDGTEVFLTLNGSKHVLEDQREYADSSYKAFAAMDYPYPKVPAGTEATQTLTIRIKPAARPSPEPRGPCEVAIGGPVKGSAVPKIDADGAAFKAGDFIRINRNREKFRGAKELSWHLRPTWHLFDDDACMENLPAVVDQVRLAQTIAPDARITIGPIRIDAPYPRGRRDPRNGTAFGAAWTAGLVKYLALAGVAEARFDVGSIASASSPSGPGPARAMQEWLGGHAGDPLLATTVTGPPPLPVDAFAIQGDQAATLVLVNKTATEQSVRVPRALAEPKAVRPRELKLKPYEVKIVELKGTE